MPLRGCRFPNTHLIVGCCNDKLTHQYKGKTVLSEDERYESLRHCRSAGQLVTGGMWYVTVLQLRKHAEP